MLHDIMDRLTEERGLQINMKLIGIYLELGERFNEHPGAMSIAFLSDLAPRLLSIDSPYWDSSKDLNERKMLGFRVVVCQW